MRLIYLLTLSLMLARPAIQQPTGQLNEVTYVDLCFNDNLPRHRTTQYKQMDRQMRNSEPSIVLRRGDKFNIVIRLRSALNKENDRYRLELSFGQRASLEKGTLLYLPVEFNAHSTPPNANQLSASLIGIRGNQLDVAINLPANMAVGIWQLKVSSKVAGTRKLSTYIVDESIYVIFNAWSQADDVYMAREDARQEYVLNEIGKIYIGSHSRPSGRTWNFGQFHRTVLPIIMSMLDKTSLDISGRADVVKVSRAVSALVNSHDDDGLLVGDWTGNYGNGLAPWQWTGSAAIFDRYLSSGSRPVKFGQCWVFGGVTTTALRTLGIPARPITNFVSAHDTDFSLTVDKFFTARGDQISGVNADSIWNFHVWSDAWMARYDLPPGYGGWQAIDATPQQTSMGVYQLGPASLEAIKQGKVSFAYDVGFVYSEVNADLTNWRLEGRTWRKMQVQTDHVGRKMLTKMIGVLDSRSRFGVEDAENIVSQYKHPEGSREERLANIEAARSGGLSALFNR